MPTFQRCPTEISDLAKELMSEFPTHQPLIDAKVRIDFVFAFADMDDHGQAKNCALKKNGMRALGQTRKLSLKDRAMGRGDAEIALDADWWNEATPEQRRGLLDHELTHLLVQSGTDDLGRPIIALRAHDYEFGWFKEVAARHGNNSLERIQAKRMMDDSGQFFWPFADLINREDDGGTITLKTAGMEPVTVGMDTFNKVARRMSAKAQ